MDILFYGQHDCVQGPLELIGAIKGKKEQGWTMSETEAMAKGKRGQLVAERSHLLIFWTKPQTNARVARHKTRKLETRKKRESKEVVGGADDRSIVRGAETIIIKKTGVYDKRYLSVCTSCSVRTCTLCLSSARQGATGLPDRSYSGARW
ncbi:hypothetical protein M431DRAFT_478145 [Trichoderma harzianum CBS 226.95]|uniref:Uncharacterized protein n=1 Tax=Trichoderma harzianum CBS 226.95 TaxID=983964 RepID=A0A2T4APL8_TRIHA|nr:hypothetical protein M431DRAFT_478145 [Trichoderma harzianum CBS 226.95]PTB59012.1 hypothetical protein M431DRAFT_478145 [Trichoderma harzianum CBS 226.95]